VSAMVNAQGSKAGAVSEELGRSQHLDLGPLLPHVHVSGNGNCDWSFIVAGGAANSPGSPAVIIVPEGWGGG
jgi:hypothetical protein